MWADIMSSLYAHMAPNDLGKYREREIALQRSLYDEVGIRWGTVPMSYQEFSLVWNDFICKLYIMGEVDILVNSPYTKFLSYYAYEFFSRVEATQDDHFVRLMFRLFFNAHKEYLESLKQKSSGN